MRLSSLLFKHFLKFAELTLIFVTVGIEMLDEVTGTF
jgi:hypothetical protein